MAEQSLALLAVGSEGSPAGVRSPKPEQVRNGANTGLLCLAVGALLCRQPWFTRVKAKVLQQLPSVRVAGGAAAAAASTRAPGGEQRDISAQPSGQSIQTHVCTGEWKGVCGMCSLLPAKRNKIVVGDQTLGCSKSSTAGALDWKRSSSCGAQEGHQEVPKFISLVIRGIQSDDYFSLIK